MSELDAHKREEQLQREEGLRLAAAQHQEEAPHQETPHREAPRQEAARHEEATLPPTLAVRAAALHVEEAPRSVEATVPPVRAPRVDPQEVLRDAGLVMIETDRAKAPEQPKTEEPQQLGRPRRERTNTPAPDDDLKQVETKQ
jgi:hypothetical protein